MSEIEKMRKPHAVFVSLPNVGHMHPMLEFAERLVSSGFLVTFLNPFCHRNDLLSTCRRNIAKRLAIDPAFRTHEILGMAAYHWTRPSPAQAKQTLDLSEEALHAFMTQHKLARVTCIIADTLLAGVQEIANKFSVPRVDFWTSSAAFFSILYHVPLLLSNAHIPIKTTGSSAVNHDTMISCIPGIPPICIGDFVKELLVEDCSDTLFQILTRPFKRMTECYCVLANTFYDLEKHTIDAIKEHFTFPFLPIGPLLPHGHGLTTEDDNECIPWLNTQAPSSVIYVSFGSMVVLAGHEIQELARGLEVSHQPFLWVLREVQESEALKRVIKGGLGIVVPWAHQHAVLSHPAIGGFLSHCGWNSTLESISAGVPMVALPFGVEQPINRKYVVEEWNIGIALCRQEDGILESEEVARAVTTLMHEKNKELRRRVRQLQMKARTSNMEGGHSTTNVERFIADMKTLAAAQP